MLEGATVVLWEVDAVPPAAIAGSRADENPVFLIVVTTAGDWVVYGPTGASVGEGSVINGVGFVELSLALAWQKEMVPGTDVVVGRGREEYGIVAKQGGQGE